MARVSIFLIAVVLIAGMVPVMAGCVPTQYTLSISSTAGGKVTVPGEGSFTYTKGTVVELVVESEEGYGLTWTGDVDSIASIHSLSTNITMYDNYSITATFVEIQRIQDWYDLDTIRDDLSGHYALMNNLDSTTPGYDELAGPTANQGWGWEPIRFFDPAGGTAAGAVFWGKLDGQEYEIRDLFINRPEEDNVGLFGSIRKGAHIENIGIVNATVTGFLSVGGLVGENLGTVINCFATGNISGRAFVGGLVGISVGTVTNCYSSSNVTGRIDVGGLVGMISISYGTVSGSYAEGSVTGIRIVGGLVGRNCGTVSNCYATGNITGDEDIGGLVGMNWGMGDEAYMSNSHSTGEVNGDEHIGGLVGRNTYCTVSDSYSTGSVSGNSSVGGLVGWNEYTVSNCYATGDVTGDWDVGGLVGRNWNGTVSDSYSIGDVTGDESVGGLVGDNAYGTVSDSYSRGNVAGNSSVGGLVGWWNPNYGAVSNSFWDTQTSGQATSAGGTGKTTAEMKDITTFSDAEWEIIVVGDLEEHNPSHIWNIVDHQTYPFLSWQS